MESLVWINMSPSHILHLLTNIFMIIREVMFLKEEKNTLIITQYNNYLTNNICNYSYSALLGTVLHCLTFTA